MNCAVLIHLQRASDGLTAWVSHTADDGIDTLLSCVPLARLPLALYPQRDTLLADWQSLCAARELVPVWPAFWRVFWHTLTRTRDHAPLPMPQRVAPAARPPATAAHPRAFRGTKYQPPKQPVPILDISAWLSDHRLLDGFFARHDFAHLPCLDAHGHPLLNFPGPDQAPTVCALLAHGAGIEAAQWPALPEAFRRAFAWSLRMAPAHTLLAWLHVWRGLGSPQQGVELVLPARLCALAPGAHKWAMLALHLPPTRQIVFLRAVLAQRACLLPCDAISVTQLMELDAASADEQRFDLYVNALLSNLSHQVSAAYTLCGCLLAERCTDANRISTLRAYLFTDKNCAHVPMADIDRMSRAVGTDGQFWELIAWENCGKLPGFDHVLRETCWEQLGTDAADQWMAIFKDIQSDEEDEEKNARRWRAYAAIFPEWHRGLIALSGPWQVKYVRMLRSHASGWDDVDSLRESVRYLLPLQQRLCRPPFSATADGDAVLSSMARNLPVEGWRQLAATGEQTWLMVERACRRDNDARLIRYGLFSLTQCWPAFTLRLFSTSPIRLMRTARLLGCLRYERRRQFLSETSHAAWFTTNWDHAEPYEACRTLYRLCIEVGLNSPVPRRLRDHIEGEITLTDKQIARHCRVSLARLPTVLLAALEWHIWRSIDMPFNLRGQSSAASHAVRLLAGVDDNRKGLRRFLLEHGQGRTHAYLDHPLNRAWFARHPRINADLWCGKAPAPTGEGTHGIRLAIETDPLETLMLGTYVGSCLGLGGYFDYSAVACLLDANKQVIYARDAAGRVLARQLVAIDERDRLVMFEVYPASAPESLVREFHAFCQVLANAVGIDMYRHREHDDYEVATVLARDWRDDGAAQDREELLA
ncbi:hypothetical protein CR152_05200 [Massilia violaceinigra]|uniref:Uncharacterized protein n=1 Tax=Massilia violaceinigra TaxID=2045208 RepID=A0A2D2DG62_9BURK|nr:hypothetical protein [Massilia violaceinigra]ATQ73982.1 hypothetical protein CR152_05200 [Massilia violaceinigra]